MSSKAAIWLVAFLLLPVSLLAETLDGFVTANGPSGQFTLGSAHILLDAQTRCTTENLRSGIAFAHSSFLNGITANNNFRLYDRLAPRSLRSTPCDNLSLRFGTRVQVLGTFASPGSFRADHVTVYSVAIRIDLPTDGSYDQWRGGALLEEPPHISRTAHGWVGTLWLDGYPAHMADGTTISAAPGDARIGYRQTSLWGSYELRPSSSGPGIAVTSDTVLRPNTWAVYRGLGIVNGNLLLYRLQLWPNGPDPRERRNQNKYAAAVTSPDYDQHREGTIRFRHAHPGETLKVLADKPLQDYVARVGASLIPPYQTTLADSDPTKFHFRFFVVQPVGRALDNEMNRLRGLRVLRRPSWDEAAVGLPDGLIVVPVSTLLRLRSEAQLAAVLSYALTSVIQEQSLLARGAESASEGSMDGVLIAVAAYQRTLRLGIRQMYLAGYDIREAPLSWALAEGHPANNPVIDGPHPGRDLSWVAAYTYQYIGRFYPDLSTAGLKRGEAEYREALSTLAGYRPN